MTNLADRSQVQLPLWQRSRTQAKAWLRRDGVVVVLFVLASVAMTYPLAFQLNDQWLAYRDIDTYVKVWDNWWLRYQALSEPSF